MSASQTMACTTRDFDEPHSASSRSIFARTSLVCWATPAPDVPTWPESHIKSPWITAWLMRLPGSMRLMSDNLNLLFGQYSPSPARSGAADQARERILRSCGNTHDRGAVAI